MTEQCTAMGGEAGVKKTCRCGAPQGRFHRATIPSLIPICDDYPNCQPRNVRTEDSMMENVKTRRGEPVLVEHDGKWLPGYIEFGDEHTGISVAVEPGGARFVLYGTDCRDKVRPDPGGERPLRDSRGITWNPAK